MFKKIAVYLFGLAIIVANAQTINLKGTILNTSNSPIPDAIVTLVRQKMKDTTGADGKYVFFSTSVKKLPEIVPQYNDIAINNGILQFALNASLPMKVEIFDLRGNLLWQEINMNAAAGAYRFDISKNCRAANVLAVRAALGSTEISFRYMPRNGGRSALSLLNTVSATSNRGGLSKLAAVIDTVEVTAAGYIKKSQAITSLDQELNIILEPVKSGDKNDPAPSLGCGKTLGSINKSGTYKIRTSGTDRTFIIDIPQNYDKNKPYRLIFGMHCMGGSAAKVAGTNDQTAYFYGIKPLATADNIQCIYVAMQGNDNGTWNADADHKFFSDLLKLCKDTLCIDTTRVFSCGFSFGAMFTYSLSLQFQNQLRAVACYAPANYNIWLPTDKKQPIAYMQVTGTNDGTCPWVNNDAQKRGGKYCLLNHVESNGCNTSTNIQIATSGKHVVTEFSGCKDGYPVKFCSFQGGHVCNAKDPGSNIDWIPVETWEFFKRF